ncbi:MAG: hypothetical protein Q7T82_08220 [Armatimonadota bacterium]|nr:hypothetical protein [Armatimonadota bacterium]
MKNIAASLLSVMCLSSLAFAQPLPEAARTMEGVKIVAPFHLSQDICSLSDAGVVVYTEGVTQASDSARGSQCWQANDSQVGIVRTACVTFVAGKGSRLVLDADAAGGEIRVQFRDERGRVIPAFAFADCAPVTTAGNRVEVGWLTASEKSDENAMKTGLVDLCRLDRQTVSVEFQLRNARLFGFAVEPGRELPLRLADGPHLFIDDYLVARSEGLIRVTNHPDRLPSPAISKDQSPMGKVVPGSLKYDPERKIFRMWHWMPGPNGIRSSLVYRESKDAVHWPGTGKVVMTFNGYGSAVLDDGPECSDPQRRYKHACFIFQPPPSSAMGMHVSFSPDGIDWTPYEGNPALPYYPIGDQRWTIGVGDIICPFWDPVRRRYGAIVKMMSASAKEFGMESRTTRPGLGGRLSGQTSSLDFVHWEQPWRIFTPDSADEGATEFYGGSVLARGDLLIAFPLILRDDLAAEAGGKIEGIGYTAIATSRDGRRWQRFREPFLDRASQPGAYDRAFAWVSGVTEANDKVYLSYVAYNQGHKTGDRQCGMATIARDRFVSREARGEKPGTLRTNLLSYAGRGPMQLWLNADASGGEIRVQVVDEKGVVIPGFSFDDCAPVAADSLHQQVTWKQPTSRLKGKSFRLEFSLRNARLYGFSFAKNT